MTNYVDMPSGTQASLYGLVNSNRDFSVSYYWGKNQFNSSFPLALTCYLRDKGIPAVYITHGVNRQCIVGEISVDTLFNTTVPNHELTFQFETSYGPYRELVRDELETIDCVVRHGQQFLRPLEVKLTTLPDNTTCDGPEDEYGSELVIRSATMRYLALSMAQSLRGHFPEVREILAEECQTVRNWDNLVEVRDRMEGIFDALEEIISRFNSLQEPLLVQPVWKTLGKSPVLDENCLDVFIWSDFAITRLFMDSGPGLLSRGRVSRQQRAALRLARFLYSKSCENQIFQAPIYDGMALGNQTDKEFAVSGRRTRGYMNCERLNSPTIRRDQIKEIILGGGHRFLSPERRFDAILFFSEGLFEEVGQ